MRHRTGRAARFSQMHCHWSSGHEILVTEGIARVADLLTLLVTLAFPATA